MTDLREALRTLARDREAAAGGSAEHAATPEQLWSRGVRRRRGRVAGAVAAAVALVVTGAGLGSWLPGELDSSVQPAGSAGQPRIPRAIAAPDPDTADTAEAGPLGRLAVVWSAERSGTDRPAVFGISARSGAYRFLALPHLAGITQVALSPDGRRVAYWLAGRVPGRGLPGDPTDPSSRTVVGVAVYDSVTGRTEPVRFPSRRGLEAEGLQWVGDQTLALSFGRYLDRHAAHDVGTWAWTPGAGAPRRLRGNPLPFFGTAPDAHGGLVVPAGNGVTEYADLAAVERRQGRRIALPPKNYAQVTVRGDRVVAIQDGPSPDTTDSSSWLVTGTVGSDGRASLARLGDTRAAQLIGWERSGRLLIQGIGRGDRTWPLLEVDAGAGTVHRVGAIRPGSSWWSQPAFATGVVALGTAARPGPPQVGASWPTAALGAGAALVLALGGGLLWRRRARG